MLQSKTAQRTPEAGQLPRIQLSREALTAEALRAGIRASALTITRTYEADGSKRISVAVNEPISHKPVSHRRVSHTPASHDPSAAAVSEESARNAESAWNDRAKFVEEKMLVWLEKPAVLDDRGRFTVDKYIGVVSKPDQTLRPLYLSKCKNYALAARRRFRMPQGYVTDKRPLSLWGLALRSFSVVKQTPTANLVRMVLASVARPQHERLAAQAKVSTFGWFDRKPIVALESMLMLSSHAAVAEKECQRARRRGKSAIVESSESVGCGHGVAERFADDKTERPAIALIDEAKRLQGAQEAKVAGLLRYRRGKADAVVQKARGVIALPQTKPQTKPSTKPDNTVPNTTKPSIMPRPRTNVVSSAQDGLVRDALDLLEAGCRVWERPVRVPVPAFVPRAHRRATIISVTDLSGGQGKSGTAVQLGLKLAEQGDRVLLVDLDYRGSMSGLCLKPENRATLRSAGRTALSWLSWRPKPGNVEGFAKCIAKLNRPGLFTVAGDERLGVWEARERARWIVQPGQNDPRFRLRAVLHNPEISRRFDWVLIDCPGRLGTATMNALAASDYLLLAGEARPATQPLVRHLLAWLARLNLLTGVCRGLSLLGMVKVDSCKAEGITASGVPEVASIRGPRASVVAPQVAPGRRSVDADEGGWRDGVYHFSSTIPRLAKTVNAAGRRQIGQPAAKALNQRFTDLAQELKQRITARGKPR
jgi:hypothetical protein